MGQTHHSPMGSRSNVSHVRRSCSPETRQVFSMPPTAPEKENGEFQEGQNSKAIVVMEGSSERNMINPSETNIAVVESDVADKEDQDCRMEQKVSKDLPEGVGSYAEDVLGTCVVEIEEILGVSNLVVGDAGLIPYNVSSSWVIDSCLEFYPKVGVACEGEENNVKLLLKDIEKARKHPVVEAGGYAQQCSCFQRS
jgi:hypothetical protein